MPKQFCAAFFLTGLFFAPCSPCAHASLLEDVTAQAELGDAEAQFNLGAMHYSGQEAPQDYSAACKWWEKAAEQGLSKAQFNLGYMYEEGLGVRQDYAAALKWYGLAAKQGHARAQFNLGVLHHRGLGVKQDVGAAREWYGKSCDSGNQRGCEEYRKLNEEKPQ